MSLKDMILEDMKTAMKQKEKLRVSTIRMLRADIKNKEINLQKELEDQDVLKIISSSVKKVKESILEFEKAGRDELVEKGRKEIAILEKYLPEPLSKNEIESIINNAIESVEATSLKNMGAVMKVVMPQVQGRADGKVVNQIVRAKLAAT